VPVVILPVVVVQFATLPEEVPKQAKQTGTTQNTPKHHKTPQNYTKLNFRLFHFLFIRLINFFFFFFNLIIRKRKRNGKPKTEF